MPMDMSTFLTHVNDALIVNNGPNLAFLLRPTSPHGKELVKEFRNPTRASLKRFEGAIVSPWDEITIQYVLVCAHVAKKRSDEAFKEYNKLVSSFLRYFSTQSGWVLPAMFSILRDLRDLAYDADFYLDSTGQKTESMEEAARVIGSKAFSACMTDRVSPVNESRKWGVYYVVGLALKSYFRVKRISLSKNILRALNSDKSVPALAQFPKSHQVTFRYYIGMLSFLNEDYAKAEQELTLAFYQCHLVAHSNQQRILTYLLPLRIFRGHLPTADLLSRFPVLDDLFSPFIQALRSGSLGDYDAALDKAEKQLVDLSLYLVLEKSREMCLRGLFRKVWLVSGKSTRIHLEWFHAALRLSGMMRPEISTQNDDEDMSVKREEAECMVANMIYKGYMKGYISHEKQMVVLGKNAFPRLADRAEPYSFFI